MASDGWRTNSTVNALLFAQFGRFNVFQLLRLLSRKRDGDYGMAAWELGQRFRFRADLSTGFHGREISSLRPLDDTPPQGAERRARLHQRAPADQRIEVLTPNYCVAGVLGPLPAPFADWSRERARNREYAMRDFFDMYNQRLNVVRFELKFKQTPGLNNQPPEQTPMARHLASLMGLGQPLTAAQLPLPRRTWLALAGLLSNCRRSAPALAAVMSRYVGAAVGVTQLQGAWAQIEPEDRIGLARRNHSLGRLSVLGGRVWDQQARLRLDLAPLPYARFCGFLPGAGGASAGSHYADFVTLLSMMTDRQCDVEVRLQVQRATVPAAALTAQPQAGAGGYRGLLLGQTAWLAGAPDSAPPANGIAYLIARSA